MDEIERLKPDDAPQAPRAAQEEVVMERWLADGVEGAIDVRGDGRETDDPSAVLDARHDRFALIGRAERNDGRRDALAFQRIQ